MSPVLMMVLAALTGVLVGTFTQVARRKGRVAWRVAAGLLGLLALGLLYFARPEDSVAPMTLFTVVLVISYAWQPREAVPSTTIHEDQVP